MNKIIINATASHSSGALSIYKVYLYGQNELETKN